MAKTFRSEGKTITCTAPSGGVVAGALVAIGQLFGVVLNTAAAGASFELGYEGIFEVPKTSALAIDFGDALYHDAMNGVVNKTSMGQKEVGIAVSDAANPSATVLAKLVPTIRTSVAA